MSNLIKITKLKVNTSLHNLAVKDDESYIANNIVVHNCRSLLVPIMINEQNNPDSFFSNYEDKYKPFGTSVPVSSRLPAKGFGGI